MAGVQGSCARGASAAARHRQGASGGEPRCYKNGIGVLLGQSKKTAVFNRSLFYGWGTGIRTPIPWSRAMCPAVGRSPSVI